MGALELIKLAATHPDELRSVINFKLWQEPRRLEDDVPSTRANQPDMQKCWEMLEQTSRSFAMVIKELDGELCRVVCLFYLILRGLDTIEDDMTLDIAVKEELLRTFHEKLDESGWRFDGSGPNEKDRHLLIHFDKVIAEFRMLNDGYRGIIRDITRKMGGGMAKFARRAHDNNNIFSVDSMPAFDLYCHYVAGLVGEGLSRLFANSGKESPSLGRQLTLSNSMGLLLQKTNILRDFREDVDAGRMFWPKAIWGKYAKHPEELTKVGNEDKARWALSEMTLDALQHAPDALEYLSLLKNQSIFNFCAIPQVMAIATLDICFNNLNVFHRNVKIRRSLTVHLIAKAANPRDLAYIFVDFAHRIHSRTRPEDPSFVKLSVAVAQIVQWAESRYPSWIELGGAVPVYRSDPAAAGVRDVRILQQPVRADPAGLTAAGRPAMPEASGQQKLSREDFKFIATIMALVLAVIMVLSVGVFFIIYFLTKEEDVRLIKFTVPILSHRVEF